MNWKTVSLALLLAGACSHSQSAQSSAGARERAAKAELATVDGVSLKGHAELQEVKQGVRITLKVKHASPGERGVHIHEIGDCSDIPGKSMGKHFSPEPVEHGLPSHDQHHFGDLGNIHVQDSGKGQLDIIIPNANLRPDDAHSLLGRAVVMHEQKDTGEGDSGQSGAPIACAVIQSQ